MSFDTIEDTTRARLTPQQLADLFRSGSACASRERTWQYTTVQKFQFKSRLVDLPPLRDHVIVLQLGGPVLMEVAKDGGCHERKWFERGQINLIPAGQESRFYLKGHSVVLAIHLSPALVSKVCEEVFDRGPARVALRPLMAIRDRTVECIGPLLEAEAASGGPGTGLMAETISRVLALHMLRHYSNVALQPSEEPHYPIGRVRRVTEHMRAHLDQDLPVADLARIGQLSPTRFARVFRDAVGQPPHRYLVGLRIERARELLANTRCSVIEIGMACGFQHPTHFATMFRKVTGFSPSAWRLGHRA